MEKLLDLSAGKIFGSSRDRPRQDNGSECQHRPKWNSTGHKHNAAFLCSAIVRYRHAVGNAQLSSCRSKVRMSYLGKVEMSY
jgi:hypothetical protein